jgi:hypothetical protein
MLLFSADRQEARALVASSAFCGMTERVRDVCNDRSLCLKELSAPFFQNNCITEFAWATL